MTKLVIVVTTTDNYQLAIDLSNKLLKANLSNCVQVESIDSLYKWQNEICHSKEWRITIKSVEHNLLSIIEFIKAHHNYELPEIIYYNIVGGSNEYLSWLKQNILPKKD